MQFEKLKVWQVSFEVAVEIHELLRHCKDYGYRDQIRRSSVSVPSNIAEGVERGTNKDSIRFLYYAKGSTGEVLTQIRLGVRFGYIPTEKGKNLEIACVQISKMLTALIKHRNSTA